MVLRDHGYHPYTIEQELSDEAQGLRPHKKTYPRLDEDERAEVAAGRRALNAPLPASSSSGSVEAATSPKR
jgi:hypothetical protein